MQKTDPEGPLLLLYFDQWTSYHFSPESELFLYYDQLYMQIALNQLGYYPRVFYLVTQQLASRTSLKLADNV